jgi:hypothetical protein
VNRRLTLRLPQPSLRQHPRSAAPEGACRSSTKLRQLRPSTRANKIDTAGDGSFFPLRPPARAITESVPELSLDQRLGQLVGARLRRGGRPEPDRESLRRLRPHPPARGSAYRPRRWPLRSLPQRRGRASAPASRRPRVSARAVRRALPERTKPRRRILSLMSETASASMPAVVTSVR